MLTWGPEYCHNLCCGKTTPCPEKRCHWFFCCNFYKYWRIFIIFRAQLHKRMPKSLAQKMFAIHLLCCYHTVWNLRHKSNTFHTILALCTCLYRSHNYRATSIDETNKTQQKVRGSKFMFKMSTIHAKTCIQTTMPLRNRCRDDSVHGPAASTPSADVLSTPLHHGSASGRPSLEAYPRCCSQGRRSHRSWGSWPPPHFSRQRGTGRA